MDGFIGEIRAFCFNYVPYGWAQCDGSTMPINQNPGLYSVIGETYGSSNDQTFTLPDLRGITPMHAGSTGGAVDMPAAIQPGQELGSMTVTLTSSQMPPHTHQVNGAAVTNASGMVQTPDSNSLLSRPMSGATSYLAFSNQNAPNTTMAYQMIGLSGQSQSHSNMQPFVALNFCICLDGEYPMPPD